MTREELVRGTLTEFSPFEQKCHDFLRASLDWFKQSAAAQNNGRLTAELQAEADLMENHFFADLENAIYLANRAGLTGQDRHIALYCATMHDAGRLIQTLWGDKNSEDQKNGRPHAALSAIWALGYVVVDTLRDRLWGLSEGDSRWDTFNQVSVGNVHDFFPEIIVGDEDWTCILFAISEHMYSEAVVIAATSGRPRRQRFFLEMTVDADAGSNLSHKFPDPRLTAHLMTVNGCTVEALIDSVISDDIFEYAMNNDATVKYTWITVTNENRNPADWYVAWMHHVYGVTSPGLADMLLSRGCLHAMATIVDYTHEETRYAYVAGCRQVHGASGKTRRHTIPHRVVYLRTKSSRKAAFPLSELKYPRFLSFS